MKRPSVERTVDSDGGEMTKKSRIDRKKEQEDRLERFLASRMMKNVEKVGPFITHTSVALFLAYLCVVNNRPDYLSMLAAVLTVFVMLHHQREKKAFDGFANNASLIAENYDNMRAAAQLRRTITQLSERVMVVEVQVSALAKETGNRIPYDYRTDEDFDQAMDRLSRISKESSAEDPVMKLKDLIDRVDRNQEKERLRSAENKRISSWISATEFSLLSIAAFIGAAGNSVTAWFNS